ncbi:hypothetical protein CHLRE_01g037650v5 [Chlamydomonas reinhardtii]|uniref:Uncharacterized protein n=1 Tax=Chlamydomonas reinhardtii TaxID=3055 RepID=A0A2K3E7B0_CHLRE|nr:uncharacterized protein CHLRE_01g037650v5 [Chlamydomonas reinhardtii]PNW88627.1 hypothetical protein CHLRE_01g037650v5 [Chlamydomonas reinhardtii]
MDIFEQADVFTPSRAVLQEEEEAAAPSASGNLRPAVCVWNKSRVRELFPEGLACDVLVIATCPTSCALVHGIPGKQLIGSVLAPGVSLAGISLGAEPLPSDRVCAIYALGSSSGSSRVLLVACQYEVARERAVAWSRALLGQVAAAHVLVLGAIPAEQFRGQGDASQEELLFLLRTRAAAAAAAAVGRPAAPLLPTGTVVGGLPAALLSHCQVRDQSAELLVAVEMVLEGRAALVEAMAAALAAVLRARAVGHAAEALAGGSAVVAARATLGLGPGPCDVYV